MAHKRITLPPYLEGRIGDVVEKCRECPYRTRGDEGDAYDLCGCLSHMSEDEFDEIFESFDIDEDEQGVLTGGVDVIPGWCPLPDTTPAELKE